MGGVYSNVVGVWHSAYEFTLDFAVMLPPQPVMNGEGKQQVVIPARVVARVKIPPAQMIELMRALSTNERLYEEQFGPIPQPGKPQDDQPLFPPGD
jgi:hypothetical protein